MNLFRRLLLMFPPETAHALAKMALRCYQWFWFKLLRQAPASTQQPSPCIVVHESTRLSFPNRVGIAAGFDKDAEMFAALGLLGAGFIEVGTVTPMPQPGNPRPRIWRPAFGVLVNHMGFNSMGLEVFQANLRRYRAFTRGRILLANLGKNRVTSNEDAVNDYARSMQTLQTDVDGFVVNLSSPNTPGLKDLQSDTFLEQLVRVIPSAVPVWIKLSPDLPNSQLTRLCSWIREQPAVAGAVVCNTSADMVRDFFDLDRGGLSGRPLFSRALECVSLARDALGSEKNLIGVGGVMDRTSAQQMRRAGADLVEVYTGFVYRGPQLLRELQGLE